MHKRILIRTDHIESVDERKAVLKEALELGFFDIIIRPDDDVKGFCKFNPVFSNEISFCEITSGESLNIAYACKDKVSHLVIFAKDWKIIPLENLIARFQNSSTKIYLSVKTPNEAKLAFEIMEVGCDGVVIEPEKAADLSSFNIEEKNYPSVALTPTKITRIENLTKGDRVCIDTCSLLSEGEGMLIGSQSSCLFLICSESFANEYVSERPFRVNAGPVHAYILCPDGSTKYLSELSAGDEVLTRKPDGSLRVVNIGRVKIEIRPMLFIEVCVNEKIHSVIVQNAETIRLLCPSGAKSVLDLSIGDEVFVRVETGGRHFGTLIDETVTER